MFINVFINRKRAGHDAQAYAADSLRMMELARSQPGFVSYRRFTSDDGEDVSISEWTSEEASLAWRHNLEHSAAQGRGRDDYYDSYTSYSSSDVRVSRFERNKA